MPEFEGGNTLKRIKSGNKVCVGISDFHPVRLCQPAHYCMVGVQICLVLKGLMKSSPHLRRVCDFLLHSLF